MAGLVFIVSLAANHSGVVFPMKPRFMGAPLILMLGRNQFALRKFLALRACEFTACRPPHLRWGPGDNAAYPSAMSRVA